MKLIDKYHQATGLRRWIIGGVAVLAVLIIVVIIYIRYFKRVRELTDLRVKTEKQKMQSQQLLHELTISQDQQRLKELSSQFQELQHQIDRNTVQIKKTEALANADLKQIEALKSWDDLNIYNKSGR